MLLLLQLEWKKLISNRTFKVMSIIYIIALPFMFFIWKGVNFNVSESSKGFEGASLDAFMSNPYMFPHVWKALGFLGSTMNFYLLGIIGILIVTNEYDFKTLRQSIINGLTRKEYFVGKILITLFLGLGFSLYYCIWSLIIRFTNTDYIVIAKVTQDICIVPIYTLQIIGFMALAGFFGWLFKRFALALIMYLIYPVIELVIISIVLHQMDYQGEWMKYLPSNAFRNLVPIYTPIPLLNGFIAEVQTNTNSAIFMSEIGAIVTSIVFVIVLIALAYRRFIKSNI